MIEQKNPCHAGNPQWQGVKNKIMIKAQDLRIGNLINFNWWFNGVGKVDLIDGCHGYVTMERHGDEFHLDEISPIPLTEDWLVKLGFKGYSHFTVMNSKYIELGRGREISIGCVGTPNEMVYLIELDVDGRTINDIITLRNFDYDGRTYVHQLQNLYYALTGKELEVKQ